MAGPNKNLGKVVTVHGIAPVYLQCAVFIVILSFLFFLAMMFVYYIRQGIGYFLLASAFLVLYLVTMFSLVMQRRTTVEVCENGVRSKKQSILWSEIVSVSDKGAVALESGKNLMLRRSLFRFDELIEMLRRKATD